MGMTQGGCAPPLKVAEAAVLIAAASNNVVKGIYAYGLADRKTGAQSLALSDRSCHSGFRPLTLTTIVSIILKR